MRISLRYKAAILIAVTEILLLGLLLVSNLYSTREKLDSQLKTQAESTAELIAASATEPLLTMDLAQLRNLLTNVIHKHNVIYVSISDHRGRILAEAGAHSDSDSIQTYHDITVADTLFGRVSLDVSRKEAETALEQTVTSNLLIIVLEMILVAFISLSIGWYLTRHLRALSAGTRSLALGQYDTRVNIETGDELGDLAGSFNEMAHQLEANLIELQQSNKRFRDMADNTSDWLWETDIHGNYTYVSQNAEPLLGYSTSQLMGISAFELMNGNDADRFRNTLENALRTKTSFYGFECEVKRVDDAVVYLEINGTPILDENENICGFRGVTRDITRRKEDQSRLIYLAEHDALTGLMDRHKFMDTLENEISLAKRSDTSLALMMVDLDGFKLINDTHGHTAGDALLKTVAQLLENELGREAILARIGGDEFGVILHGTGNEVARSSASRIINAIQVTPMAISGHPVQLFASVGICSFPDCAAHSEALVARADSALHHAKSMGHNQVHVFDSNDTLIDSIRTTVSWKTRIQDAINDDRLSVVFQPIFRVSRGKEQHKRYFEALVRIKDESGGCVQAHEFINMAEQSGQIIAIDKYVIRSVINKLGKKENGDCCVSINLSGRSLNSPEFFGFFHDTVIESKVDASQLVFEITESAAVSELAKAESFLSRTRKLGYKFALDDFGVGFSSFSYLKHLPVDQIKIDGSFVRQLDKNAEDQIFVRAMQQVAKELGLLTVAEFVETQEVLDILVDIGVDYVQGFYLATPEASLTYPILSETGSKTGTTGQKKIVPMKSGASKKRGRP